MTIKRALATLAILTLLASLMSWLLTDFRFIQAVCKTAPSINGNYLFTFFTWADKLGLIATIILLALALTIEPEPLRPSSTRLGSRRRHDPDLDDAEEFSWHQSPPPPRHR